MSELRPWEWNPRELSKAQRERIMASVKAFGSAQPLLVGPDGEIYDGHARLLVYQELYPLGDYKVRCWQCSRALTPKERRALVLAFNGGASGSWDWDKLNVWPEVELIEWGFNESRVSELMTDAVNTRHMLDSVFTPDDSPVDLGKKYSVALIDPPWEFKTWSDKGKGRSPENHYPVLDLAELKTLKVLDILEPDAAVFMWAIPPGIEQAFELVRAWNKRATTKASELTFRTFGFFWVKTGKDPAAKLAKAEALSLEDINGVLSMGLGYYTRANCEPCLLFVRGSMPPASRGVKNTVIAERMAHSAKPTVFYERIEEMYPDAAKIEIFARSRRPGWDAIGNEIDGRDIRDVLR